MVRESSIPHVEAHHKIAQIVARIEAKKDPASQKLIYPLQELARKTDREALVQILEVALNRKGLSLDNLSTTFALGDETTKEVVKFLSLFLLAGNDEERREKAEELAKVMSA